MEDRSGYFEKWGKDFLEMSGSLRNLDTKK